MEEEFAASRLNDHAVLLGRAKPRMHHKRARLGTVSSTVSGGVQPDDIPMAPDSDVAGASADLPLREAWLPHTRWARDTDGRVVAVDAGEVLLKTFRCLTSVRWLN